MLQAAKHSRSLLLDSVFCRNVQQWSTSKVTARKDSRTSDPLQSLCPVGGRDLYYYRQLIAIQLHEVIC